MRGLQTILLLIASNTFMTFAWYGHLRFKDLTWAKELGLFSIVLVSWGIAFFEYCLMVPANRFGHLAHGGPFNLVQLKVIQEAVTLAVFAVITALFFKGEPLKWNHLGAAMLLIGAVWLVFKD